MDHRNQVRVIQNGEKARPASLRAESGRGTVDQQDFVRVRHWGLSPLVRVIHLRHWGLSPMAHSAQWISEPGPSDPLRFVLHG